MSGSVFPQTQTFCIPTGVDNVFNEMQVMAEGLTKRELFAAMAMQGLCACNHPQMVAWSPEKLAANAREQADALLAELEKSP